MKKPVLRFAALAAALLLLALAAFPEKVFAYSDKELCQMARQYYQNMHGYTPEHVLVDHTDGSKVTIHLFEITGGHTATSDWYEVERDTGVGTSFFGETIDLSLFASKHNEVTEVEKYRPKIIRITTSQQKAAVKISSTSISGIKYQTAYKPAGGKWVKQNTAKSPAVIKGLMPGRKYSVRVRGYKKINGSVYYSRWSKIQSIKIN